jgi:predicted kinase
LRDRFREVAKLHGYQTKVIYLDIPLAQIRIRMQSNEQTKERYAIKEQIFADLLRNFEPPFEDENVLIFNQNYAIRDWLKTYLD